MIIISLGSVIVLLGAQLFLRSFLRSHIYKIVASIGVMYGVLLLVLTLLQFKAWGENELTQFLIPPYAPLGYFTEYIFFRTWAPYLISFIVALGVYAVMKWGNKKKKEALFFPEEPLLVAVSIFLVGYPGIIIFSLLFLIIYSTILIMRGPHKRYSPYFLWLPTALCAILVSEYILEGTEIWRLLSI